MTPRLSIVVPAYNEETRLPRALDGIWRYLQRSGLNAELIVVDDGSADGTSTVALRRMDSIPVLRVITLNENVGKGGAVRAGMLASRGEIVAFTDADLSAPIDQLTELISDLEDAEVAIVSRALPGRKLGRRQSTLRELFGKGYAALVNTVLLRGVPDAQCGLKAFRGPAARDVYARVGERGVVFDAEALLLVTLSGGRISQRPAVWSHDPDTRIDFDVSKSIDIAIAILRIKFRHRTWWPPAVRGPVHGLSRTQAELPPKAVSELS